MMSEEQNFRRLLLYWIANEAPGISVNDLYIYTKKRGCKKSKADIVVACERFADMGAAQHVKIGRTLCFQIK